MCVGGKTGGAIWVCLDFFAPPFASREKVENLSYRRDCKSKAATMRCRIRSGMTAGREGKIVNSFTVVAVLWAFEKVTGTSYK